MAIDALTIAGLLIVGAATGLVVRLCTGKFGSCRGDDAPIESRRPFE